MQAQVFKIHSDFYYVKNFKGESFTCKLRDVLKKQKTKTVDVIMLRVSLKSFYWQSVYLNSDFLA